MWVHNSGSNLIEVFVSFLIACPIWYGIQILLNFLCDDYKNLVYEVVHIQKSTSFMVGTNFIWALVFETF